MDLAMWSPGIRIRQHTLALFMCYWRCRHKLSHSSEHNKICCQIEMFLYKYIRQWHIQLPPMLISKKGKRNLYSPINRFLFSIYLPTLSNIPSITRIRMCCSRINKCWPQCIIPLDSLPPQRNSASIVYQNLWINPTSRIIAMRSFRIEHDENKSRSALQPIIHWFTSHHRDTARCISVSTLRTHDIILRLYYGTTKQEWKKKITKEERTNEQNRIL